MLSIDSLLSFVYLKFKVLQSFCFIFLYILVSSSFFDNLILPLHPNFPDYLIDIVMKLLALLL